MEVVADSPTFDGNANNKTIQIGISAVQADSVGHCTVCDANVIFHDAFGSVPSHLDSVSGVLADGDYTIKLYRDGSTLVGSKAIAINHPDRGGSNGTFLDETGQDQIVTFYLNQQLAHISQPTVDFPHTRASTHLSANIIQPAGSDTTITLGQSLTIKGSAASGVGGTKKYAWDWNASNTNQETFDTEFSTSTTAI